MDINKKEVIKFKFNAFSSSNEKYEIEMYNSETILLILSCNIKNNEYISINSLSELKKNKIFIISENIKDIIEMLIDIIKNDKIQNKKIILNKEENNNNYFLSIPINLGKLQDIKFEFKKKEKNVNEIFYEIDNKFNILIQSNLELKNYIYEFLNKKRNKNNKNTSIHYGTDCDGCDCKNIKGIRYKCLVCEDFDYCENCEEKYGDTHGHPFIKINKPNLIPKNFGIKILKNKKILNND
jgi:hypothetical protein